MTLDRFLRTVLTALQDAGVPSMLTGAVAAALHGAGRATMDVDLVIDPSAESLDQLVGLIEAAGFYVSREAAHEALATGAMFNVIDPDSGWTADLIIRKTRPFSVGEFSRRQSVELLGVTVDVARVEDLILAKVEWATQGASARQVEDAATLRRMAGEGIDVSYIEHWVDRLEIRPAWKHAQDLANRRQGS